MEAAADLFEGCEIIIEMCVDDIDILHLQSFERALEALSDMFAIDEHVGVDIRIGGDSDLGRDDDFLSGNVQIFEDVSELCLCFAEVVDLCCVEVVDAVLECRFDELFIVFVCLLPRVDHVSQGDYGGAQAGVAEEAVLHLACLV